MYNHVTNVHMLNDGMAGLGWVPLKLDALVTGAGSQFDH